MGASVGSNVPGVNYPAQPADASNRGICIGRPSLDAAGVDGFAWVPTVNGPPTGVPNPLVTGYSPICQESSAGNGNGKLWFYSQSGAWVGVSLNERYAKISGATGATVTALALSVGAIDASYSVGGSLFVSAFTAGTLAMTCTYTDLGGTARVVTMALQPLTGVPQASAGAAGVFSAYTFEIMAKAGTTITIGVTAAGWTGTYTVSSHVRQIS